MVRHPTLGRLRPIAVACLIASGSVCAPREDVLILEGLAGRPGGRLTFAQRVEPKTLNPAVAGDSASREVIHRMTGDLIHINRETQRTEPALAKAWSVSPDGLRYLLELRQGVRFSDGHPFDADDVVFTFQAMLDEKVGSPQRDLLLIGGKPVTVQKLDSHRVAFLLPAPYAAAERLFDGFAILPRHLLARAHAEGKLGEAWGLRTPPAEIAGLGPFRLKEFVPGQRIVLERNPYYWKADGRGNRLPYLAEAAFVFAGSEDGQTLRFQSGEADVLSRLSARNFVMLERERERKGHLLRNLGPGLEHSFLFFNLGGPGRGAGGAPPHRGSYERRAFRQAVSLALDRGALVRLAYLGFATPLAGPVPPGNKAWIHRGLPAPSRQVGRARELLAAERFTWSREGALLTPDGRPAGFTILTSAGNPERVQMATLIQADLKELGIRVEVAPLEFRSLLDRVLRTRQFEACLLSLASPDADPNPDLNLWLSSGGTHLWNPGQKTPATDWEAEIDRLMRGQMAEPRYAERKRLFDRVQELAAHHLPLIPLVSPNILAAARKGLGNFRPAVIEHYALWNIDEMYWSEDAAKR